MAQCPKIGSIGSTGSIILAILEVQDTVFWVLRPGDDRRKKQLCALGPASASWTERSGSCSGQHRFMWRLAQLGPNMGSNVVPQMYTVYSHNYTYIYIYI